MTDAAPSAEQRLRLLTRRERECLALVTLALRSKEIAPILGIDPATVDNTLKRAGKRAGCSDRKALARLLQLHEPEMVQSIVQRLGQGRNPLAPLGPEPPVEGAGPLPSVEGGRQWGDLPAWQKRMWAAAIASGILLGGGTLIAAARYMLLEAAPGR